MKKKFRKNNRGQRAGSGSQRLTTQSKEPPRMIEEALRVVNHYLVEDTTKCSAMDFWREYSETDDIWKKSLAEVAKKYLTPLASTIDVERLFSSTADILSNDRNRLLPQNARKILFLRESLTYLNFRY